MLSAVVKIDRKCERAPQDKFNINVYKNIKANDNIKVTAETKKPETAQAQAPITATATAAATAITTTKSDRPERETNETQVLSIVLPITKVFECHRPSIHVEKVSKDW